MPAKFRLIDCHAGRCALERCDFRDCYGDVWRVIDTYGDREFAEIRLAYAEGRIGADEQAKRLRAYFRARKKAPRAA